MTISVGFSKPSYFKIGAALIRLYEGTPYTHVYLKAYSEWMGGHVIFQASHGAVHCASEQHFLSDNIAVAEFEYELDESKYKRLFNYCLNNLQKPYGFLGLLKIALKDLIKSKGDGERSFHCSEFALRALPELTSKDPDFVTPRDLFRSLESAPFVRRVK
jgi:hypothetical protein